MPVSRLLGPMPLSPAASSRLTSLAAGTESQVLDSECIPRERSSAPGFLGQGVTDNTPARRLSNHDITDDSLPRRKGMRNLLGSSAPCDGQRRCYHPAPAASSAHALATPRPPCYASTVARACATSASAEQTDPVSGGWRVLSSRRGHS
ncbi:hypothetical protein EDB80DRAFT_678297 [Ilyonectria destructans]|nr:hypothetical protein EDB80DRAFT_678297 [Ilyonectria destructans]